MCTVVRCPPAACARGLEYCGGLRCCTEPVCVPGTMAARERADREQAASTAPCLVRLRPCRAGAASGCTSRASLRASCWSSCPAAARRACRAWPSERPGPRLCACRGCAPAARQTAADPLTLSGALLWRAHLRLASGLSACQGWQCTLVMRPADRPKRTPGRTCMDLAASGRCVSRVTAPPLPAGMATAPTVSSTW